MSICDGIVNARFLHFFEELSAIPRISGHTEAATRYLVSYAQKEDLPYYVDEKGNVIIYKAGQKCAPDTEPVILQGHIDMVGDKAPDSDHDFLTDPLSLSLDGDDLHADRTTLGADDGIAAAYMLAILEDPESVYPPIEAVFTVDEEIGLQGAAALDMTKLKGKRLINIDSEEEGILTAGCAGGMSVTTELSLKRIEAEGMTATITLSGLKGGHSGVMIDKGRGNAIKMMGRLLYELKEMVSLRLISLEGGARDNVIPFRAVARVLLENEEDAALIGTHIDILKAVYAHELAGVDDGLEIAIEMTGQGEAAVMTQDALNRVLAFLLNTPYGVQAMERHIPDLVETSANLGRVSCTDKVFTALSSVRSSITSKRDQIGDAMTALARSLDGRTRIDGTYPAWEFRDKSPLREVMCDVYRKMTGKDMVVEAVHAGLECGIFYQAIEDLDAVSIGPNIRDIHTYNETLSLSSARRVYAYLRDVLKALAQ
ncbi:MAG: aminoacyl-histidine dipeptidase [Lachnospiraceae bacterium]|nr:aminoacyl-histidine dipeptidase [Lachnospiraceae bacterium]